MAHQMLTCAGGDDGTNNSTCEKSLMHTTSNNAENIDFTSFRDNYNLSPGMESGIFIKQEGEGKNCSKTNAHIALSSTKLWGLCPKSGTKNHSLPPGPGKHFSNLMYNARSETLYEKRTFQNLALAGKTCIWAIDGFFEWKQPSKDILSNSPNKQPYFVHRNDNHPLIIPGLFTRVKTGNISDDGQEEMLETFTLITTAACEPLRWLHHRQPTFIWDMHLAEEWLMNPSQELIEKIATLATEYGGTTRTDTREKDLKLVAKSEGERSDQIEQSESCLAWHPVTKQMSSLKYRNSDSVNPIKIEKVASVKSFFTAAAGRKAGNSNGASSAASESKKRSIFGKAGNSSGANFFKPKRLKVNEVGGNEKPSSTGLKEKAAKKGSITNFFSPKSS
eukprot:CAMPEP_0194111350 /NCGR_PEP_ID=MMETSP0150-20130528/10371_1 /TAXON_ID=122233 /ORGANISM="Chaetoceros debilis, Strain MM31A-1" /LENGTH=390 /DNA_ID=CAMNT_0038800757 /DNA_START=230 /DNA_END=1402 /DNA_ORIENTATION=-